MNIETINTQKVLAPTNITLADYAINPYRGCGFGCLYCYSQENKNIKSGDLKSLGVKLNAPEILKKELRFKSPKRVLLGSTTECFQYQEANYKITEKILQTLNEHDIACTILTKSHLVADYLSLIRKNPKNKIYFTINCANNKIIKFLEENSSPLEKRLAALEKIIKNGVDLRVHLGPFIPYLSSLKDIIDILPQETKEIDIELYHHKMGNFPKILELIAKNIGEDLKTKLRQIYESEKNYLDFAADLEKEIKQLNSHKRFRIFYIVPDFNKFYNSHIDYEKALF